MRRKIIFKSLHFYVPCQLSSDQKPLLFAGFYRGLCYILPRYFFVLALRDGCPLLSDLRSSRSLATRFAQFISQLWGLVERTKKSRFSIGISFKMGSILEMQHVLLGKSTSNFKRSQELEWGRGVNINAASVHFSRKGSKANSHVKRFKHLFYHFESYRLDLPPTQQQCQMKVCRDSLLKM